MSLLLPDWPPKQQYIGKPSRGQINQTNTTQTERTQQVAAAGSVLPVIYGRNRIAGKIAAVGVDNIEGVPVLVVSIVWGAGPIDAIESVYVNGELMPHDYGEGYTRHQDIQLTHYLGTTSQGVDPWLSSAISGYADDNIYTINGQQLGVAYSVLSIPSTHRLGGEFPRVEVVVRGAWVFDPRENRLAWSNDFGAPGWVAAGQVEIISSGVGVNGKRWQLIGVTSNYAWSRYRQQAGTISQQQSITAIAYPGTSPGFRVVIYVGGPSVALVVDFVWSSGGVLRFDGESWNEASGAYQVFVEADFGGWYRATLTYIADAAEIGQARGVGVYPALFSADVGDSTYFSGIVLSDFDRDHGYIYTAADALLSGDNYSNNPALAAADYRSNSLYGMGKAVDWASVGHAAAFCDRLVGSTPEKSREFGMLIDQRASNESWMQSLRAYAGCAVLNRGGKDYFLPEYKTAVSGSITASDIVEGSLKVQKRSLRNAPTLVRVHYTDTSKDPWVDHYAEAALPGVDTGAVPLRESNVRMSSIQRYSQAMREAVERLNLLNAADLDVSFRLRDEALKISEMDVVELTHPIGLTNQKLRITGKRAVEAGRYEFRASEYFDGAYDDQIYTAPTYDSTNLPSVGDIPTVTGLSVDEELFFHQDKTIAARLVVTWDDTNYQYLHEYHVQVLNDAGDVLQDVSVSSARFVSMALPEEESYTVRLRIKSVIGVFGVVVSAAYFMLGKTALPANVDELRIERVQGGYVLLWDQVPDIDVGEYVVKRVYGSSAYWDKGEYVTGGDGCTPPLFVPQEELAGQITLMVKARDTTGHESATAVAATLTVPVESELIIGSDDIKSSGFSEYSVNTGVIDGATGDLVAVSDGSGGYQELVFDFLFTTARPSPYYGIPEYRFGLDATLTPAADIRYFHHPASVMTGVDDLDNYNPWPGVYLYHPREPGAGGHSTVVRITIPAGATQGRISKLTLNRIVPVMTREQLNIAVPLGAGVDVEYAPPGGTLISSQVILQMDGGDARSYQVTKPGGYPPNTKLIKTFDAAGDFADGHVDVITKYY